MKLLKLLNLILFFNCLLPYVVSAQSPDTTGVMENEYYGVFESFEDQSIDQNLDLQLTVYFNDTCNFRLSPSFESETPVWRSLLTTSVCKSIS